ncbi:MAG TPA: RNA 2',3'-cyclic phosphodiesterase [Mobilitalea sp.]|nr:RNA 2',3'-cyclic phosphodiesterase [Mobilitalea sp.]
MRLFTAITLDEDMKDIYTGIINELKKHTISGSFTHRENLHLTVNFIGETKRLELVKELMQQAVEKTNSGSFTLDFGGLGSFRRREGDICFIKVSKDSTLWKLQKELESGLSNEGFVVDGQEYRPHLTLSRRTTFRRGYDCRALNDSLSSKSMEVSELSLMQSERIQGKLVYNKLYSVRLKDGNNS